MEVLSDESSSLCSICCSRIEYYAIGACDHSVVCMICCLRLRTIFQDSCCPVCKSDNECVIISDVCQSYKVLQSSSNLLWDKELKLYTISEDVLDWIKSMLSIRCPMCNPYLMDYPLLSKTKKKKKKNSVVAESYSTVQELQQHVLNVHSKQLCRVCLEKRKVFICEQRLYSTKDLERHVKYGDPPRKSDSAIEKHPKCTFCHQVILYDKDEFEEHMHHHHMTCFICVRRGINKTYDKLEHHFKEEHHLCPEPECLASKFVVFDTDVAFQAHRISMHAGSQKMSRSRQKASRQLLVDFQVRRQPNHGNISRGNANISRGNPNIPRSNPNIPRSNPNSNVPFLDSTLEERNGMSSSSFLSQPTVMSEENSNNLEKNRQVVRDIKIALGGDDSKFEEFRRLSADFQSGNVSSEDYYDFFFASMDPDKFRYLFLDLVSLLPDSDKKQQMYLVYRRRVAIEEKQKLESKKLVKTNKSDQSFQDRNFSVSLPASNSSAASNSSFASSSNESSSNVKEQLFYGNSNSNSNSSNPISNELNSTSMLFSDYSSRASPSHHHSASSSSSSSSNKNSYPNRPSDRPPPGLFPSSSSTLSFPPGFLSTEDLNEKVAFQSTTTNQPQILVYDSSNVPVCYFNLINNITFFRRTCDAKMDGSMTNTTQHELLSKQLYTLSDEDLLSVGILSPSPFRIKIKVCQKIKSFLEGSTTCFFSSGQEAKKEIQTIQSMLNANEIGIVLSYMEALYAEGIGRLKNFNDINGTNFFPELQKNITNHPNTNNLGHLDENKQATHSMNNNDKEHPSKVPKGRCRRKKVLVAFG